MNYTAEIVILKCFASPSYITLFANNVLVDKLKSGQYYANCSVVLLVLDVTL